MPKLKIQKNISVQADELFESMQSVLTQDKEVKALEPDLKIEPDLSFTKGHKGLVKGSRISGSYEILPHDSKSMVSLELSLPLMLSPFKGLVQKKIEEKLEKLERA